LKYPFQQFTCATAAVSPYIKVTVCHKKIRNKLFLPQSGVDQDEEKLVLKFSLQIIPRFPGVKLDIATLS